MSDFYGDPTGSSLRGIFLAGILVDCHSSSGIILAHDQTLVCAGRANTEDHGQHSHHSIQSIFVILPEPDDIIIAPKCVVTIFTFRIHFGVAHSIDFEEGISILLDLFQQCFFSENT